MVWFEAFLATAGISFTFMILVVLFITRTPAFAWLIASFRGTPLIAMYRRDKSLEYVPSKITGSIAETKKHGLFVITPESVNREKKTGLAVLTAFADYGATIPPEMSAAAQEMKELGIENIEDAEKMDEELSKENKTLPPINIPFHKTIKFHDIIGWFKYNINPNFLLSVVERKVAIEMKKQRSFPIGWITAMAVLFVAAGIAVMIIMQAFGNQPTQVIDPNTLKALTQAAAAPRG